MQNLPNTIKGLSDRYDINPEKLYYLSKKKKYSIDKIKKKIFENKYGSGNHYQDYFNYYLPRFLNPKYKFEELKQDFFTDYELSGELTRESIEQIWELIMKTYLKDIKFNV